MWITKFAKMNKVFALAQPLKFLCKIFWFNFNLILTFCHHIKHVLYGNRNHMKYNYTKVQYLRFEFILPSLKPTHAQIHEQTSTHKLHPLKHPEKHLPTHKYEKWIIRSESAYIYKNRPTDICQWSKHNIYTVNQSMFSTRCSTPCSCWASAPRRNKRQPCLICITEKRQQQIGKCIMCQRVPGQNMLKSLSKYSRVLKWNEMYFNIFINMNKINNTYFLISAMVISEIAVIPNSPGMIVITSQTILNLYVCVLESPIT